MIDKQSEYLALNNQILALEKNAFERTLLIGFIGLPCLGIMDNGFYYWIPFLIMLLLIINANYTVANLKKAVHLKVYLQTALENSEIDINLSNFLIHQHNYKQANKKEIKKIKKEFNKEVDITIPQSLLGQVKGLTFIFLILYIIVIVLQPNLESKYIDENITTSSEIYLSWITFIIGFISVGYIDKIKVKTEKEIAKKVLEAYKFSQINEEDQSPF